MSEKTGSRRESGSQISLEKTEQGQTENPEVKKGEWEREVLEAAMDAGHILLENGAEIFRVEETIDRICRHYGVDFADAFVLSNGILMTAGNVREQYFAKVQHIPVGSAHLNRVAAVNQLSREIETGCYTIEEVRKALKEIEHMPGKRKSMQILASGIGSGCFCHLFGGNFADSSAAFLAGLVLYLFVLYISVPKLSKIVGNIAGGALVTCLCMVMYHLKIGEHLNYMIIGSIIPLVPGVPFTNAIRDIADGDYISGSVRMLDAMLVFFCIALGVGLMFTVYSRLMGGAML